MTRINYRNGILAVLFTTTTTRGEMAKPRNGDARGNLAEHDRHAGIEEDTLGLLSFKSRCAGTNVDDFPGSCNAIETGQDEIRKSNNITAKSNIVTTCEDYYNNCPNWARGGLCYDSRDFMHEECPLSCNVCPSNDEDGPLPSWHYGLGEDVGVPQELDFEDAGASEEAILWVIEQARVYLKDHEEQLYDTDRCTNEHPKCTFWALTDECQNDEDYMIEFCAPVCGRCDDILEDEDEDEDDDDDDFDCFEGLVDAWRPGDIEHTFRRLTSEPFTTRYQQVEVLSSPETTNGPWIITLDSAISQEECQILIDAGTDMGYDRSITTHHFTPYGGFSPTISQGRTSSTAWCFEDCMEDPQIDAILERLSDFASIPSVNSEHLQLLKYSQGQKYDVHHDMIPDNVYSPQGPRVLTAYVYLSDVPAGGGTHFDKLGITVQPKQGRVVLWPNILDSDLQQADDRTSHATLPVERGTKYGANA